MALDIKLIYLGEGRFTTATASDLSTAVAGIKPNEALRAKLTRRRSVQQNEFFHALIKAAFDNQRAGPQLPTWEHLKAHLLIRVGWCDEVRLPMLGIDEQDVSKFLGPMAAALRRRYHSVETSYDQRTHECVMRFARSVRFDPVTGASPDEMHQITHDVTAMICAEIVPGCTPDQIFKIAKEAAANNRPAPPPNTPSTLGA